MENTKSVILNVDEATKEYVDELQDALSSDFSNILNEIGKIDSSSTLKDILNKVEESKRISDTIPPLQSSLDKAIPEIKEKLNAMESDLTEIKGMLKEMARDKKVDDAKVEIMASINTMKDEASETYGKTVGILQIITNLITPFWKKKIELKK